MGRVVLRLYKILPRCGSRCFRDSAVNNPLVEVESAQVVEMLRSMRLLSELRATPISNDEFAVVMKKCGLGPESRVGTAKICSVVQVLIPYCRSRWCIGRIGQHGTLCAVEGLFDRSDDGHSRSSPPTGKL